MKSLSRRGLQLAAGTLVMLIVSIVVVGMALVLSYQAFCGASELVYDIDDQSQSRIDDLLTAGGGRVVVADNTQTASGRGNPLCGGSTTRIASFTVGITSSAGGTQTVCVDEPETSSGAEIHIATADGVSTDGELSVTLDPFETYPVKVLVIMPNDAEGEYVYALRVAADCSGTSQIFGGQQLYVQA